MSNSLTFQTTIFDVVNHNNQPWIRSTELARALGYSDERRISILYSRHSDEFTNGMTEVLNLGTSNLVNETRIFSLRGCHLLAMFSRTPVAKAFRVWVLDVLETLNNANPTPALTPSTPGDRAPLRSLVYAWSKAATVHVDTCWPQVKAHFQLSRIDDLPVEWIPDALAFVQSKIDALPKALPISLPKLKPNPIHDFAKAVRVNKRISIQATQMCMDGHKKMTAWAEEAQKSFSHAARTQEIANLEDFVIDEHIQVLKRLTGAYFDLMFAFSTQCSSMAFMAQLLERNSTNK